jgi:hypothetical protein
MIQHRYFAANEQTYEQVRTALDAAWGLPDSNGTTTCLRPAADNAPRDGFGRVVVGVLPEWCAWEPAATLMPQLLASGAVAEISEAEYFACLGE